MGNLLALCYNSFRKRVKSYETEREYESENSIKKYREQYACGGLSRVKSDESGLL